MADKLDRFYNALQADGALKGVKRDTFRNFFMAKGEQGYKNRLQLFNALKADGALGNVATYEDFSRQMIHATPVVTQQSQKQTKQNNTKPKTQGGWSMVDHPTQTAPQRGEIVKNIIDDTQRQWEQGGIKTIAEFNKNVRKKAQKYQVPQEKYDKTNKKPLILTTGAKPNGYLRNDDTGKFEPSWTDKEGNIYFDKHEADIINDYQDTDPYYLGIKEREKAISDTTQKYWAQAGKAYDKDVDNINNNIVGTNGDLDRLISTRASHLTHYDLQTMMDNVYKERGKDLEGFIYNDLVARQPNADKSKMSKLAKQFARQYSDRLVYEYAVKQNAPKDTLDFFWRKVYAGNLFTKGYDWAARLSANGKVGDKAAFDLATEQYGQDHNAVGAIGTGVGMLLDPTTYVGGWAAKAGVSLALKGAAAIGMRKFGVGVGSRLLANTTLGKYSTSAFAGALNLGTYEGLSEGANQLAYGGKVNLETGKVGKYSSKDILGAAAHGAALGAATGVVSPFIGNVADKYVKATSSTIGKAAIRTGGFATSALAEGTIFAAPELYEAYFLSDEDFDKKYAEQYGYANIDDDAKRNAARNKARNSLAAHVWSDSMGTIIGIKAPHMVTGAFKTAMSLRRYRNPRNAAERTQNRLRFSEIIRDRLDKSANDLRLTDTEKTELSANGYGSLKDLLVKTSTKKQEKKEDLGIQVAKTIDFDPFKSTDDLMNDKNVSQATKAKVYYYLTGQGTPMGTVTSYNKYKGEDGKYVVETYTLDGKIVTRRYFDTNEKANAEVDKAKRQVELNAIAIAESQKDDAILKSAIQKVAKDKGIKEDEAEKDYISVKTKNKSDNSNEKEIAEAIDAEIKEALKTDSPEAIRNGINQNYKVNINSALRKEPSKRSDQENQAVDRYIQEIIGISATEEGLTNHLSDVDRDKRYNNAYNLTYYSNSEYTSSDALHNYDNAIKSLADFLGISESEVQQKYLGGGNPTDAQSYNSHVDDYAKNHDANNTNNFAYLLDRFYESYSACRGVETKFYERIKADVKKSFIEIDGRTQKGTGLVHVFKDKDDRQFVLIDRTQDANSGSEVCFIRYYDDNTTTTISGHDLDKCQRVGTTDAKTLKEKVIEDARGRYKTIIDNLREGNIIPQEGDKVILSDGRVTTQCEVLKVNYGEVDANGNPKITSVVIKTSKGNTYEYDYSTYKNMLARGFEANKDRRVPTPQSNKRSQQTENSTTDNTDYKRDKEAQQVTLQMADNYDQRAVQTPVVVSKDGVVLSGNGRTMAGEIAARQGTDTKYNGSMLIRVGNGSILLH